MERIFRYIEIQKSVIMSTKTGEYISYEDLCYQKNEYCLIESIFIFWNYQLKKFNKDHDFLNSIQKHPYHHYLFNPNYDENNNLVGAQGLVVSFSFLMIFEGYNWMVLYGLLHLKMIHKD